MSLFREVRDTKTGRLRPRFAGLRTIDELVRKELAQFRRDRLMMAIILISPVMQLVILGLAASFDLQDMPFAVYDEDRSEVSRALADSLFHGDEFVRASEPRNPGHLERMLDRGEAGAALVIPPGFARDRDAGRAPNVQLIVDGSESMSAALAVRAASRIIGQALAAGAGTGAASGSGAGGVGSVDSGTSVGVSPGGGPPPVAADIRVEYNPALESRLFFVPGILALVLMVITMLLTSIAIVKEKEHGTLEQLIVSPLRPSQIILGKLLPYAGIGFFDMLLVLAVAVFGFRVVPAGSIPLLLALSAVFILTTLGLGLFVSTVSSTQQEAMMTAMFFVMMPMMYLSGFVFPIENMPQAVQAFTYLLPLRYYFTIIRGVFLRGVGLEVLWPQALALVVFGGVILGVSVARFRKRLD